MSSRNDITGDKIRSKPTNDAYRNSPYWDNVKEENVMEKYINEEGNVGILVSHNYGAGWSTWNSPDDFYRMDKTLVKMKLEGKSADEVRDYCEEKKGYDPYMGGWDDVVVEWLDEGTKFTIQEYDGNETLVLLDILSMTA